MKTLSCQYTSERKLLSQQGLSGDKVLSKDQNILCEKSCNVINFAKLRKCPNWAKKGLIERKVWLVLVGWKGILLVNESINQRRITLKE